MDLVDKLDFGRGKNIKSVTVVDDNCLMIEPLNLSDPLNVLKDLGFVSESLSPVQIPSTSSPKTHNVFVYVLGDKSYVIEVKEPHIKKAISGYRH